MRRDLRSSWRGDAVNLFGRKNEGKKQAKKPRYKTPVCSKCEKIIEPMDMSLGSVVEEMGAFFYSGSEGHLFEPLFEGVICPRCGTMMCSDCQSELYDTLECPRCGGLFKQIMEHRLQKIE
jgi:hypothetical protein